MAHYYNKDQDSPLRIFQISIKLLNENYEFYTASGIFSIKGLDIGTKLLLSSAEIKEGWKILDFGCGWGAVGIIIAKRFPSTKVDMIDVNKRAIKMANLNIGKNNVKNTNAFYSDFYEEINEKFDTILVNPPQVAGKDVCFKIIVDSRNYLCDGGLLQLVARHNKGGVVLRNKMMEVFGNVKDTAKKAGYRIYVSKLL